LIDAFSECEQAVRTHDPDRFFAVLFAPEDKRPHLYALAALYYEIAHAASAPREPMLKEIRLTWWRETIERARAEKPRDHAVARALAETLKVYDLPDALFEAMITARGTGFSGAAEAEAYADATVGSLMRLMGRILGGEADVRDAAIAYGLAGRHEGVFADMDTDTLAKEHFARARRTRIPRALLPAVLPVSLVPLYLKRSDPPLWRKQIAYLGAALRGRN
jgi:phytoene/squalene synthetase